MCCATRDALGQGVCDTLGLRQGRMSEDKPATNMFGDGHPNQGLDALQIFAFPTPAFIFS